MDELDGLAKTCRQSDLSQGSSAVPADEKKVFSSRNVWYTIVKGGYESQKGIGFI